MKNRIAKIRKEQGLAIANSSSVSYLQVGRPETIMIHSDDLDDDLAGVQND